MLQAKGTRSLGSLLWGKLPLPPPYPPPGSLGLKKAWIKIGLELVKDFGLCVSMCVSDH